MSTARAGRRFPTGWRSPAAAPRVTNREVCDELSCMADFSDYQILRQPFEGWILSGYCLIVVANTSADELLGAEVRPNRTHGYEEINVAWPSTMGRYIKVADLPGRWTLVIRAAMGDDEWRGADAHRFEPISNAVIPADLGNRDANGWVFPQALFATETITGTELTEDVLTSSDFTVSIVASSLLPATGQYTGRLLDAGWDASKLQAS